MTWWILLFCLVVAVWGLVDTVDRDPGAARLWMVALLVICALAFALYADEHGLMDFERDTGAGHVFQDVREMD